MSTAVSTSPGTADPLQPGPTTAAQHVSGESLLWLGEQLGLQWSDVDWRGGFLVVRRGIVRGVETSPKSHRIRRVHLSGQLVVALKAWRRVQEARWLKKGKSLPVWVFPSLDGTALEERNIRHVLARMLTQAGLHVMCSGGVRRSKAPPVRRMAPFTSQRDPD